MFPPEINMRRGQHHSPRWVSSAGMANFRTGFLVIIKSVERQFLQRKYGISASGLLD
jgi:hypothetical protein